MPVEQLSAHPDVVEDAGKVALKRGPIVYCLEGCDQPDTDLFRLVLPKSEVDCTFRAEVSNIAGHDVTILHGTALTESTASWENTLYRPHSPSYVPVEFTAIPYFAWANRSVSDITVWIRKQF